MHLLTPIVLGLVHIIGGDVLTNLLTFENRVNHHSSNNYTEKGGQH